MISKILEINIIDFILIFQSSNWVSKATPLFTQNLYGLDVYNLTNITKLVECPVVDKTPLLALVL